MNVEEQVGEFELEIIAIDDGSTDNSLDVLNRIAEQKTSRLSVLSIVHGGVSAARNAGIKMADGDAVLFLDADDLISPGYLQEQCEMLRRNPTADASISNCLIFDKSNHQISMWAQCKDDFALHLCASNIAPIHSFMVRRSLVEQTGLFDELLPAHEDYEYWLRAAACEKSFVVNNNALALYRKHPQSLSTNREIMGDTELEILRRVAAALKGAAANGKEFPPQGAFAGYVVHAASMLSKAVAIKDTARDSAMNLIGLAAIALCRSLKFFTSKAVKENAALKLYAYHLRIYSQHFSERADVVDAAGAVLERLPEIARLPLSAGVLNTLFEATTISGAIREALAKNFINKYRYMI